MTGLLIAKQQYRA